MNDGDSHRPNWTGVERAGDHGRRHEDIVDDLFAAPPPPDEPPPARPASAPAPPAPASEASGGESSPSAVDVLRLIADRLAALEHLVAGMAGVDPTPDADLVAALAERNDQLSEALLRRVDERFTALSEALSDVDVGTAPPSSVGITSRLDAIDRRLTALETFTTSTPSWLPELFAAVAESKAPTSTAGAPAWVGQLAQDLRSLRSQLARLVG